MDQTRKGARPRQTGCRKSRVPLPCFFMVVKRLGWLTNIRDELASVFGCNYSSFISFPCFGGLTVVRCLVWFDERQVRQTRGC